ncbi:Patatin protein 1 [Spatholobus suberectus]|nr:Patatin protein 1 [Spatholobus suberectus]
MLDHDISHSGLHHYKGVPNVQYIQTKPLPTRNDKYATKGNSTFIVSTLLTESVLVSTRRSAHASGTGIPSKDFYLAYIPMLSVSRVSTKWVERYNSKFRLLARPQQRDEKTQDSVLIAKLEDSSATKSNDFFAVYSQLLITISAFLLRYHTLSLHMVGASSLFSGIFVGAAPQLTYWWFVECLSEKNQPMLNAVKDRNKPKAANDQGEGTPTLSALSFLVMVLALKSSLSPMTFFSLPVLLKEYSLDPSMDALDNATAINVENLEKVGQNLLKETVLSMNVSTFVPEENIEWVTNAQALERLAEVLYVEKQLRIRKKSMEKRGRPLINLFLLIGRFRTSY